MDTFLKVKTIEKKDKTIKDVLLDKLSEGLVVVDENGDIVYSNNLANQIMNTGLFGPIDIVCKNVKEVEYNGHTYKSSFEKLGDNINFKGTVAVLTDVIGQDEASRQIALLNERLEHANNFKNSFMANMSHEVRTPIHAIIGFAELINKEEVPEEVKEQVNMIKESSYSLLAIINDVLDLSKLESNKMELVCSNYYISYVIRDIEATFSLLANRKGLEFHMHLDDNIPSNMYGDKIRLRSILLNLLNNAIKFTKEGRVDFYIRVMKINEDKVTLQFEVRDTGIGIKSEDLERIFESFSKFDLDKSGATEGRGLGLSLAKGYTELMGGTIKVNSEYGVGSSFVITVDQRIIDASPVDMSIVNARKNRDEHKFKIRDYKVLVVDDNPINLTVADGLMKAYGLIADRAGGGREAVKKCAENEYDIIFMDQMMPELDGIMAQYEIRKISDYYANECKIVVLTADAMVGVRDRLISQGFDEYLCKPLEIHRLETVLKKFVPADCIVYEDEEEKEKSAEKAEKVLDQINVCDGEEWTKDNLSQVAKEMITFLEERDFEQLFELMDNVNSKSKGPKTAAVFSKIDGALNDMDMDALSSLLGEMA